MKKKYIVPGLWESHQLMIPFLSFYKNSPYVFYDDIDIDTIYGNFTWFLYDGGRTPVGTNFAYLEDIELIQNIYNNILNINTRFICSNTLIQKKDFNNKYCNLILKKFENSKNSIVINDEQLYLYIKTNYPSYQFISSTTKCLNINEDILKSKVELLINEKCNSCCPYRKNHYITVSKKVYNFQLIIDNEPKCLFNRDQDTKINYNQLNDYINIGINNFKLEGRTATVCRYPLLIDLLHYCIKPEYEYIMTKFLDQSIAVFDLYNYNLNDYYI